MLRCNVVSAIDVGDLLDVHASMVGSMLLAAAYAWKAAYRLGMTRRLMMRVLLRCCWMVLW